MNIKGLWIGVSVLSLSIAACTEPGISPEEPQFSTTTPSIVECPASETHSTSAWIGPLGGSLSLDGSSVTVPLGAVLVPTFITMTIPAGNYMQVDVSAAGVDHYVFERPVTMTIDYSRCTRTDIDLRPLSIWYIDSSTHELLENMGGTDDKIARKVTFGTPHLSGYVIAD
jgi:hypothetical protein